LAAGQRVLDVGCGALTAELVARVSAANVSASIRRHRSSSRPQPASGVVGAGFGGSLPFADAAFGVSLAQLVVHFMRGSAASTTEMTRVTREGRHRGDMCLGSQRRRDRGPVLGCRGRARSRAEQESHLAGSATDTWSRCSSRPATRRQQTVMSAPVEHANFEAF
jgi:SAM-dependent methyltransferase